MKFKLGQIDEKQVKSFYIFLAKLKKRVTSQGVEINFVSNEHNLLLLVSNKRTILGEIGILKNGDVYAYPKRSRDKSKFEKFYKNIMESFAQYKKQRTIAFIQVKPFARKIKWHAPKKKICNHCEKEITSKKELVALSEFNGSKWYLHKKCLDECEIKD